MTVTLRELSNAEQELLRAAAKLDYNDPNIAVLRSNVLVKARAYYKLVVQMREESEGLLGLWCRDGD